MFNSYVKLPEGIPGDGVQLGSTSPHLVETMMDTTRFAHPGDRNYRMGLVVSEAYGALRLPGACTLGAMASGW